MQTIAKEMHYPYNQCSVTTTREILMGQSSPSQISEGKVEESHVAHDVANKCKISGKIQTQHAVHNPCTASMPSKNHVRMTSRQII